MRNTYDDTMYIIFDCVVTKSPQAFVIQVFEGFQNALQGKRGANPQLCLALTRRRSFQLYTSEEWITEREIKRANENWSRNLCRCSTHRVRQKVLVGGREERIVIHERNFIGIADGLKMYRTITYYTPRFIFRNQSCASLYSRIHGYEIFRKSQIRLQIHCMLIRTQHIRTFTYEYGVFAS